MDFQCLDLCLPNTPYKQVQEIARSYNRADPAKWQQRLVLVDPMAVFRKEALLAAGFPIFDVGYIHGSEMDLVFRIRRSGYKIMLAGDTWVHHDHDYLAENEGHEKGDVGFQKVNDSILRPDTVDHFVLRWGGIQLYEDVCNFWIYQLETMPIHKKDSPINILGVDVKCGQPILDIKNRLCQEGLQNIDCYAFSQVDKYIPDLNTICGLGNAYCDREEFLNDYLNELFFDYIVVDKPINQYKEPIKVYQDILKSLRKGGILFLSLLNTQNYIDFLSMAVSKDTVTDTIALHIPLERFLVLLSNQVDILETFYNMDTLEPKELLMQALDGLCHPNIKENLVDHMLVKKYTFMVRKK